MEEAGIELKNDMEILTVSMDIPSLDDTMPDNERLVRALKKQTGAPMIRLTYTVIRKLAEVLRESDFSIQCLAGKSDAGSLFIYDVFPKDEKVVAGGIAIDILDILDGEEDVTVFNLVRFFQQLNCDLTLAGNEAELYVLAGRSLLERRTILDKCHFAVDVAYGTLTHDKIRTTAGRLTDDRTCNYLTI